MNKETYLFNISDIDITVNTEEVITFYGESYKLTPKLIKDSAAKYTAQIKYYRMCNRGLTPSLIQRLLNEEYLMKKGESDGFKLQLAFAWFVEIKKEEDALYGSFRYAMKAYCLDNPQVHSRQSY